MGFLEDFGDGFSRPFVWGYNQVEKRVTQADTISDKLVGAGGNVLDILGGNSNILVYGGILVVGLFVLNKVL